MATKQRWTWVCQSCGHTQAKWAGQCPACNEWNCLQEEAPEGRIATKRRVSSPWTTLSVPLGKVDLKETPRWETGLLELDRLLGGGVVPGLFGLVGGEPGVGKSTLMMQLASKLVDYKKRVLYVCGEESVSQTSLRANRLGIQSEELLLLNEGRLDTILEEIQAVKPDFVVIDSIQILYKDGVPSAPGSVTQVRECASDLMQLAKKHGVTIFVIGHVTKSGEIAGPRVLEHLVDTVLYFEGDKDTHYRMLRAVKNRFGTTDEVAVFQMTGLGLHEVPNPSELFLEERQKEQAGSVIVPALEGTRTILLEIQALVSKSPYPNPTRRSAGIDANRLALLLAVLDKYSRLQTAFCDIFVSVAGGLRVTEPASDLAVLLAIASSSKGKSLEGDTVVVGEIGLGGEVRSAPRIEMRLKEVLRMGFAKVICPKRSLKAIPQDQRKALQVIGVANVKEAIHAAGLS